MKLKISAVFLFLCTLFVSSVSFAHKPSDSYLSVKVENKRLEGRIDVALRDLDYAISIDTNNDSEITWDEVVAKHPEISSYILSRIQISSDGRLCTIIPKTQMLDDHSDGTYSVLFFEANCAGTGEIHITYNLFFDVDPQHKGILKLTKIDGSVITGIFGAGDNKQSWKLSKSSVFTEFRAFVNEGIWHIWTGFDHLLFLLSLLLPSVFIFSDNKWNSAERLSPCVVDVLKIVTAFTLSHSITLTLATVGWVSLPSKLVESSIALSVILAALNNVYPIFQSKRWVAAFIFGLIHGFGFASSLADLLIPNQTLLVTLLGFNIGVEIGQLAIVCTFIPIAYFLRNTSFYKTILFRFGSFLISIVAIIWLIERAFDIQIIGLK